MKIGARREDLEGIDVVVEKESSLKQGEGQEDHVKGWKYLWD